MTARATAVLITICVSVLSASGASIRVVNGDRSLALTDDDLQSIPQHSITVDDHGKKVTFEGVLLADVLQKVAAPRGDTLKGDALAQHVVIEASDDYRVTFAIAETDPEFSGKSIYLVTKRDG
jgi:hypothetical protein